MRHPMCLLKILAAMIFCVSMSHAFNGNVSAVNALNGSAMIVRDLNGPVDVRTGHSCGNNQSSLCVNGDCASCFNGSLLAYNSFCVSGQWIIRSCSGGSKCSTDGEGNVLCVYTGEPFSEPKHAWIAPFDLNSIIVYKVDLNGGGGE